MDNQQSGADLPRQPVPRNPHTDGGDWDLVLRIGFADRAAFEQLYFDYHERLVKFLFRVIRRHEDLEEVINDTFLIVWQHAGDFRGASRVSTWIFGIAYRRALETIRMSSVRVRDAALKVSEQEPIRQAEDGPILETLLSRLPPEQCLVIVLAYCMNYSCEEIAAIVACSVNTVQLRMSHARRELRAIIPAANAQHGTLLGVDGPRAQTKELELL